MCLSVGSAYFSIVVVEFSSVLVVSTSVMLWCSLVVCCRGTAQQSHVVVEFSSVL